jgi:hypothetical protein
MLENMLRRGEATVQGLADALGCSRKTIERLDGDFEPIPTTGRPGWTPTKAPVTTRWVEPEPQNRTRVAIDLERTASSATEARERARKVSPYGTILLPSFDSREEPEDSAVPLAPCGPDEKKEAEAEKLIGRNEIP